MGNVAKYTSPMDTMGSTNEKPSESVWWFSWENANEVLFHHGLVNKKKLPPNIAPHPGNQALMIKAY